MRTVAEFRRMVGCEVYSGNDYFMGNFIVGGYAWVVEDMQMLDEFIPAKGKLGLWEHVLIL